MSLLFALHVDGEALDDVFLRPNTIDASLHCSIPPIAAFNGMGCGRQQRIIQEGQRLFDIGGKQFFKNLAQVFKPSHTMAQFGSLSRAVTVR